MTFTDPFREIQTLEQSGKAVQYLQSGIASGTLTSAAATSGGIVSALTYNNIGTTLYSALQGMPEIAGTPGNQFMTHQTTSSSRALGFIVARAYKLGTASLTSVTSSALSSDAATRPFLKTIMGQANQPLVGIPMIQVTTATTVTAPQLKINYKNQANQSVTGTKTLIFPNAATNVGSCFIPRLEEGDSGITDITGIDVTTASSTGAINVWLIDPFSLTVIPASTLPVSRNFVAGDYFLPNLAQCPATSGNATSQLVNIFLGSAATTSINNILTVVLD